MRRRTLPDPHRRRWPVCVLPFTRTCARGNPPVLLNTHNSTVFIRIPLCGELSQHKNSEDKAYGSIASCYGQTGNWQIRRSHRMFQEGLGGRADIRAHGMPGLLLGYQTFLNTHATLCR
jgi:hypothetical protein